MRRAVLHAILWLLLSCFASSSVKANAPETFSVQLLDGKTFSLEAFRGEKPVLLKFWASWCAACLDEMPAFRALHEQHGERVAFLAVNVAVSDPLEKVKAAVREHGLSMPVSHDDRGDLWNQFKVIGTPMHVLIDRDGRVIYRGHGHDERLEKIVQAVALEKAGRAAELTDIDGSPVALDAALNSGQPLVVYHFATWCESYLGNTYAELARRCRQFRDGIAALARLEVPGLRIVGLATRYSSNAESVAAYRDRHDVDHALVFDTTGEFARRYGVRDFPHIVVIRDGVVVYSTDRIDSTLLEHICKDAAACANDNPFFRRNAS